MARMVKVPHKSPRGPVVFMASIKPCPPDPLIWKFDLSTEATGWENLDVARKNRCLRRVVTVIIMMKTVIVLCKPDA